MKNTPLYIISSEQGIPIPNTRYDFIVSLDDLNDFEVARVRIGDKDTLVEEAFILGITQKDSLSLSSCEHVDEIHESVAEVGLFCELLSVQEGSSTDRIITCKVVCKAYIKKILRENSRTYAEIILLSDKSPTKENKALQEITTMLRYLVKDTKLLSKKVRLKILSSKNLIYMSNLIVDDLACNDDDRFNYLQSKDPLYHVCYAMKLLLVDPYEGSDTSLDLTNEDAFRDIIDKLKLKINLEKSSTSNPPSIKEKINLLDIHQEQKQRLLSESDRLEKLPPGSLEAHALNEYLTWICDLPWGIHTSESPDLKSLISILDESHYGLPEVKQHILEYLTIQKLTDRPQGTVLCFVGEPGTGKTSIAKQIAKACNRKIIKIAVGGMSDEAELRGHRRTYVAARPGRIITGLKSAKTSDPLILIDEVDKIDTTRGDPLSALLEILDPEQNPEFIDRYIEVPFDISKAIFITTANYLNKIPAPLKDRMEIVKFRNYTKEEKLTIISLFIVPQSLEEYSLKDMNISFCKDLIAHLASKYEIRDIKRKIKKLLRKAAVDIVVNEKDSVFIDLEFFHGKKAESSTKTQIGFS